MLVLPPIVTMNTTRPINSQLLALNKPISNPTQVIEYTYLPVEYQVL